jgi:AbrB family looped-hinge helix DNA binding protein
MSTLTMSSKGQLTVPRELRTKLKLRPGCQVDVRADEEGRLVLTPLLYGPEEFLARRGPRPRRAASVVEMDAGVRKGATRGRRSLLTFDRRLSKERGVSAVG